MHACLCEIAWSQWLLGVQQCQLSVTRPGCTVPPSTPQAQARRINTLEGEVAALRGEVEGLQTDLAAARDSIAAANSRIQEQQSELDSNAGRRLAAAGGYTQHVVLMPKGVSCQ